MKTRLLVLSVFFFFYAYSVFAQDIIYTISGELDNQKVPLDSILVENLSNNTWITFNNLPEEEYYQINLTKKSYWGATGIDFRESNPSGFTEVVNTPGKVVLKYSRLQPAEARVSVFNLNGQEIYSSASQAIYPGNSVEVKLAETGVFLVRVESDLGRQAFKGIGLAGVNNYGVAVKDNGFLEVTTKSAEKAFDFEYSIGDSLRISVYKTEYYSQPQLMKIENSKNVDFLFKNSEVIISGVSDAFVDLDNQPASIQDYNPLTGKVSLSYTGESPELIPGNIIAIDVDTMGYLRKVTKVVNNNDGSVTLQTKQAYLNEVFVNKEINLDTELIEVKSSLKSAGSKLDIFKALTDENGYIHPVKIIYHYKTGNIVKSALTNNSENDGTVPLFDISDNFSNTTIFQDDNVHFYIDEGYSKLNGNATFYFWFKEGTEIDPESKIKKGELEQFSYNMKNTYDFKTHLKLEITDSYSSESTKELLAPKSVTAEFLVGVVPVWITFNLSIHGKMTVSSDASVIADWSFQSKLSSTAGAAFSNETGDFVQNQPIDNPPDFTIDPLKIEGDFNLNARLELYPRVEAMVYSFVGPFVELVPYTTGEVKGKVTTEITGNGAKEFWAWNSNVTAGFDTRVGAKLDFAGLFEDEEFGPLELNLYNEVIWEAPKKLSLISELPQEVKIGDIVNLEFEVSDSEGNPLAGCPVYIEGDGDFTDEISTTGTNGRTSISWEIISDENANNKAGFTAKIFDGNKNIVGEISKSVDFDITGSLIGNWKITYRDGQSIYNDYVTPHYECPNLNSEVLNYIVDNMDITGNQITFDEQYVRKTYIYSIIDCENYELINVSEDKFNNNYSIGYQLVEGQNIMRTTLSPEGYDFYFSFINKDKIRISPQNGGYFIAERL